MLILCPDCNADFLQWTGSKRFKDAEGDYIGCLIWCYTCGFVEVLRYVPFELVEHISVVQVRSLAPGRRLD